MLTGSLGNDASSAKVNDGTVAELRTVQPEWFTRTVRHTETDPNTGLPVTRTCEESYISRSEDALREDWCRGAERELQRIADEAPAGMSAEVAQAVVDDGGLAQGEEDRQEDFESSLEYCDEYANLEEQELKAGLE